MLFKINDENKTLLRVFITYGLHIWVLIFVCNVVIFYSIRFFINASTTRTSIVKQQPVQIMQDSSPTSDIATPVPTAAGPVIDLSFSLPGIGTNGGNLIPLHTQRDVTIYLYDSAVNTSDKNVKPVYAIKTQADYDNDPDSPTYTFFINNYIDLGTVESGNYQMVIQSPQSLRQLIKSPDLPFVGGQIFEMQERGFIVVPPQTLITGDIYPLPNSDDRMDINDYNILVSCYNVQKISSKCADSAAVDLDDNGIVDGIDYNILLMNFRTLLSLGFPVPTIDVNRPGRPVQTSPTVPTKSEFISPTSVPARPSSGNSFGTVIILFLFILFLGSISFAVYKFHLLKFIFPKKSEVPNTIQPPSADQAADQSAGLAGVKNIKPDSIEKSCYLKKVKADDQKKGAWVTLADDGGITRGFCPDVKVSDGFFNIKGVMKNDDQNKPYIFITEINPEV